MIQFPVIFFFKSTSNKNGIQSNKTVNLHCISNQIVPSVTKAGNYQQCALESASYSLTGIYTYLVS